MSERSESLPHAVFVRGEDLFKDHRQRVFEHTDRLFAVLMLLQWVGGLVAAIVISPRTWSGSMSQVHIHVWTALLLGGAISSVPIGLALLRPGQPYTRYTIAAAQMLTSALLIHLSGGRIETHFHVFGSLAILAFYRDWRVFVPATVVIALDHMVRGIYWPESVFGVSSASQWRWVEHAAWVVFEDIFLVLSCRKSTAEMRQIASRRAQLEATNEIIATKVDEQTGEIRASEELFRSLSVSSPIGVFRTNADGTRWVYANDRCTTIMGISNERLLNEEWTTVIHAEDRADVVDQWNRSTSRGGEFSAEFRVIFDDQDQRWIHVRASRLASDEQGYVGTIEDVTEQKQSEKERQRMAAAVDQAAEAIVITDIDGQIQYVNPAFEAVTGYDRDEVIGESTRLLKSGKHPEEFYRGLWGSILGGNVWAGCFINRRKDGTLYEEEATISAIRDESGDISSFVAVKRDVTQQRSLEQQLSASQKLESIGQLAAGIAHEINTPTQYVGDNTRFLQEAFQDLLGPLQGMDKLLDESKQAPPTPETLQALRESLQEADVEYLAEEIPRAVEQSLEGIERVTRIVRAMKEFSHPAEDKTATDLNRAIDSTLTVARNEWKYLAELETDFDDNLGSVPCVPGDFNQVVLNIVVNAAHAIGDVVGDSGETKGNIRVSTKRLDDWAEIRIADSGKGIPEDIRKKIFDPFFTTKEVGKGTGQGLSIAHNIIVQKHGGSIRVDSEVGKGTTFVIRLPLVDPDLVAEEVTA